MVPRCWSLDCSRPLFSFHSAERARCACVCSVNFLVLGSSSRTLLDYSQFTALLSLVSSLLSRSVRSLQLFLFLSLSPLWSSRATSSSLHSLFIALCITSFPSLLLLNLLTSAKYATTTQDTCTDVTDDKFNATATFLTTHTQQ